MKRTRQSSSDTESNDDELVQMMYKKRKLQDKQIPYFLMTTDEDSIFYFYEIDTEHKLFPIVIKAFKTKVIEEKDEYPSNEVALFNTMVEYGSSGDNYYSKYEPDEDPEQAIKDFLGLDKYTASDFTGFLKSRQEGIDLTMQRALLSSHVLFLRSWC
jgi:hypothetical protein